MLPKAKKSFSQNFLVDQTVVRKIISAADIQKGETVFEIGPGTGVLTQALVDAGARIIAVEADKDLIKPLKDRFGEKIELIHADALNLQVNITQQLHDFDYKLVANIPYNITSSIIESFLKKLPRPSRMVLMVQKEVVDRITAKPPKMSLLSVVCQIYAQCERVAVVKAGAFRPIPKVDSAIVRLDLYKNGHKRLNGTDPEVVIALAKRGFASKRKQLKTNLGKNIGEKLKQLDLDPNIRAENLTVENWCDLSLGVS